MGDGNGILRAGNRAKAISSIVGLIFLTAGTLFGVFAFGVEYATSDVRQMARQNKERIETVGHQVRNMNLMLVELGNAIEAPQGSEEQRQALKRMRVISLSVASD